MNTADIIDAALDLSGMDQVPADTKIINPCDSVSKILMGIDIQEQDLYHAKETGCDLVMAHHPLDKPSILKVFWRQETFLTDQGVDPVYAHKHTEEIIRIFESKMDMEKFEKELEEIRDTAEELELGLMNIHLPCDEIGRRILQEEADILGDTGTVSGLMDIYSSFPEISEADDEVELVCGDPDSPLGRTFVFHAGGTNGGYSAADALFDAGIGTLVYIHLSGKETRKRLTEESKGSLIVTGHYGSDSLGINPLLDKLEEEDIEIICCNNMIRR